MTPAALVDNDVLQKIASYGLMPELQGTVGRSGPLGILGAARFIVRRSLRRLNETNAGELSAAFEEFLQHAITLEPTQEEIDLATDMEEVANRESLGFDSGESQLCAIAITRGIGAIITGDKRAIQAAEDIQCGVPALVSLVGKIVCLEQLMLGVIHAVGYDKIRSHVCAMRAVDTALSICLRCWSTDVPSDESIRSAFESYIEDLRRLAPSLLHSGQVFPSS